MNKKISTFDEGLDYLRQAKKEYANSFFVQIKLEVFRRLLGRIGWGKKLFHGKSKDNHQSPKDIAYDTENKFKHSPWMTLAFVVCISFIAGVVSRKILAGKQKS